ncbi:MAG: hypothetical protein ABIP19_09480 [Dermatophilaceae bacterium]
MPADNREREGVVAVGQRGGEVVGRRDAPFAGECGQDGDVLRMDIAVAGEPCKAQLSEDVSGGERAGCTGGAERGDHFFGYRVTA